VANEAHHEEISATVTSSREEAPLTIPIGQMSVLEDLVRQVEETIRTARNMPLSSSVLIDRQSLLELVDVLKRSIPEEIARARAVIRDRDEVIAQAQAQAQRIAERARAERQKLLSQTEIVEGATREADRRIAEAEEAARKMRSEAEHYVEGKLATFEIALQKTLKAVERGRARIAGRIEADQLASAEDAEDLGTLPGR